jgi:hypothetical protein
VYYFRRMYHGHGNLFLAHVMVLLGDICQVEPCFSPFGDSVSLSTR